MGGRGQGIHTPHLTYTSSLPLSVSYGPSGFEQMSSVPRAQGSWQTLGRSQALTCFKRLVGRGSSTFLERGRGGAAPRDTMLSLCSMWCQVLSHRTPPTQGCMQD